VILWYFNCKIVKIIILDYIKIIEIEMNLTKNITGKVKKLNNDSMIELDKYLDKLIHKQDINKEKRLKLGWAGALSEVKKTSRELQKEASDWIIRKNI
jgi:hypothetical protein